MNLKVLTIIILYYSLTFMFFMFAGSELNNYTLTGGNLSAMNTTEADADVGTWTFGISFARWWLFMTFGIGLPASTPAWFTIAFMIWQTGFSIYVTGFIISSIWNG